jgi:hypothetical protein
VRDSRTARESVRRRRDLREDVEVPMVHTGVRMDLDDRADRKPEFPRRSRRRRLCAGVAPAAPEHGRATDPQERGGVFRDHVRGGEGAGNDEVAGAKSVPPLLGSGVDNARVGGPAGGRRASDERTLAGAALDQRNPGGRERDRERQSGKPGSGAQVGDLGGLADLRKFEGHERIGKVVVDDPTWIADGRRREPILGHDRDEGAKALAGAGAESVPLSEGGDRVVWTHN